MGVVELFLWLFVTGGVVGLVNSRGLVKSSSSLEKQEINCKDESGKEVPWYIVYKLPRDTNSSDTARWKGAKYLFLLPDSDSWISSEKLITQNDSILGVTMAPLYDNKINLAYVMYNDQPPTQKNKPKHRSHPGHTKGFIISGKKGGIWIQHSAPNFPSPNRKSYSYWTSSLKFAQIFSCISVDNKQLDSTLGEILTYSEPTFYDSAFPQEIRLPNLQQVVTANKTSKVSTKNTKGFKSFTVTSSLPSSGISSSSGSGTRFSVFAKSSRYIKGIYSDWLAPALNTDLLVQSWRNGAGGRMTSHCDPDLPDVVNIEESRLTDIDGKFDAAKDHSKWAISTTDKMKPWTCISDLNRMESQKRRGGVAICMSNAKTWRVFSNSVSEVEPCTFFPQTETKKRTSSFTLNSSFLYS